MTYNKSRLWGLALSTYLGQVRRLLISPDTHYHLKEYVKGQLSDVGHKNVQRIARLDGCSASDKEGEENRRVHRNCLGSSGKIDNCVGVQVCYAIFTGSSAPC